MTVETRRQWRAVLVGTEKCSWEGELDLLLTGLGHVTSADSGVKEINGQEVRTLQ